MTSAAKSHPIPAELNAGDWLHDSSGNIRIMAISGRYAMVRRPHASPFVVDLSEMRTCGGMSRNVFVGKATAQGE